MKMVVERFDSIESLEKTIMSRKTNKVFRNEEELSSESGTIGFTGTKSLEEAISIMKNGYEKPLSEIKKEMANTKIKSNTSVQKSRPTVGVVGFAPCVPNAIMGLPNSMIAVEKVPMKSKVLTIMYSIGVNSSTNQSTIIKAGTAVLKLINTLELKGYRVKLEVEFVGTEAIDEFASLTVNIKDWRQHLDLKKLSFPLVHPSALRRIAFRWMETVPGLSDRSFALGYGCPKANLGYETAKQFYIKNGLCNDKTYYINVPMAVDCNYDTSKMMEMCGMAGGQK